MLPRPYLCQFFLDGAWFSSRLHLLHSRVTPLKRLLIYTCGRKRRIKAIPCRKNTHKILAAWCAIKKQSPDCFHHLSTEIPLSNVVFNKIFTKKETAFTSHPAQAQENRWVGSWQYKLVYCQNKQQMPAVWHGARIWQFVQTLWQQQAF